MRNCLLKGCFLGGGLTRKCLLVVHLLGNCLLSDVITIIDGCLMQGSLHGNCLERLSEHWENVCVDIILLTIFCEEKISPDRFHA